MQRKTRHTPEEKERAVKDYINGKKSRTQICSELNISTRTIQDWAGIYRKHGISAFQAKKRYRSHTKEFKIKIVEEYISGSGSSIELALKYDLSSGLLRKWILMYNSGMELKDYDPKQSANKKSSRN